jgi:sarcosine oxidase subunit beta
MSIDHRSEPPPTTDLVIVGGGIAGAATAFHAARAGLGAVLVERRPLLASLTTAAAAGGYRLQLDNEEEYRLISESVDLFLDFAEATGQSEYDPAIQQQGYLWVTTEEGRAAQQRDLVAAQRSWGLRDVELLAADALRDRFSWVSPAAIQARYRGADGLIDPRRVAFGLAAGARVPVVVGCEVTGLRLGADGSRVTGVETSAGTISAAAVVIAAGPFSRTVAGWAGVALGIETVQRTKVVMPEVPEVPSGAPMTIDDDTGAHWRPAFGGAFLLFTDPSTPPSEPAEDLPLDHRFPGRLLDPSSPQAVARVAPFWADVWARGSDHVLLQAGQYVMTPDRRPLLGELSVEGLFVNTGYSGHGIMGSPAGSRIVIDAVTGKLRADDNPFRPDRTFEARPRHDAL